jgi:hypothetical protein
MKHSIQKIKKSVEDTNIADGDNISLSAITTTKPIEWSIENEEMLVEWCDYAQCYKWLHSRSHKIYSYRHAWFTIPIIALSTITGTASFAEFGIFSCESYAPMVIGTINICIGLLTTLQQYLRISELNESHRVSSISWDKFARNIRIELAKAPSERMDAAHFLKINRQVFDQLMETSPTIPEKVIKEFRKRFTGEEGTEKRLNYDALKKPDICDTIVSANEHRHHWYLEQKANSPKLDATNLDIKNKEDENAETIEKYKELQELMKHMMVVHANEMVIKKIDSFVTTFIGINGRAPLKEEIRGHFQDDDIEEDVFVRYLDKLSKMKKDDSDFIPHISSAESLESGVL